MSRLRGTRDGDQAGQDAGALLRVAITLAFGREDAQLGECEVVQWMHLG